MKKRHLIPALVLALGYSLNAFAVSSPIVDAVPSSVDADTYTLTIFTQNGATVTVVGGPAFIAPVTDGQGADAEEDGEVEITVGLTQNATNTFSITAEKNGDISNTVVVEIVEHSAAPSGGGDTTPPQPPQLDEIPDMVQTVVYTITGSTEPNANIYAYSTLGIVLGTTAADETGYFEVQVELEPNKTNRINVTAEDERGNEGSATQAVIRQVEGDHDTGDAGMPPEETEEKEEELITSAQIFFGDVEGHWAEDFIYELAEDEVVSGKSEGVFAPNAPITRAELTKIAILAFGYSVNTTVKEHPFSDVPKNAWFAPYVEEAERLEIVEGYPTGGFGPNDYITRAAALKIILEASGLDITGAQADFPDVPSGAWFTPYVAFASSHDIVSGYEDGTFGPGNNITRAQVAKIVIKTLELQGD
jgi:hypothetical protein